MRRKGTSGPTLRLSEDTYNRLVALRRGMDTFDDVLQRLLDLEEEYLRILREHRDARTPVESDRTQDS